MTTFVFLSMFKRRDMPTYEYKCNKCGDQFELFQSIKDKPIDKCPKCGGSVKRLVGTGAGIIFKGKGFYQTDYKGTGSKDKPKSGGSACSGDCSCCGD